MKKFLCLCLMLSLLVACSSEKDTKPNPAASPATQTAIAPDAPAAPEAITSLSGEYVLTQTDSNKAKFRDKEYTCQTTHTFTLQFINDQTVHYTAKSDQSVDPPDEGMMCQAKLYSADVTGTYEIKYKTVTVTFPPAERKIPWTDKNIILLRLKNANALEIVYNGSVFQKQ